MATKKWPIKLYDGESTIPRSTKLVRQRFIRAAISPELNGMMDGACPSALERYGRASAEVKDVQDDDRAGRRRRRLRRRKRERESWPNDAGFSPEIEPER